MSADFWAGYVSGAAGIIIGNPLDLIKVRLQAGENALGRSVRVGGHFEGVGALVKGAPAPILGYGALNALLFVSYNRTQTLLGEDYAYPSSGWKTWVAGATGGLATWVVSAPTELIKCRVQLSSGGQNSWSMTKEIVRSQGIRGLYFGGGITSLREAVGYGFYFWSYELSKQWMTREHESDTYSAAKVLVCGGLAGIATWTSIFPLDVIKTRVQTQPFSSPLSPIGPNERAPLLDTDGSQPRAAVVKRLGAVQIARDVYHREGLRPFFRGLGVCSVRAFLVNGAQWSVYEWIMARLKSP
ncbi:MAG: hypothetical protein M1832_003149 [Thelocarpon impressellum]|nr:MAG: hypothetical protein M1832_003149 [Thelocarpon impressellum]